MHPILYLLDRLFIISSLFAMIASTKAKYSKIANGRVVAHKKPNAFKRVVSRFITTLLTPIDALGHAIVWNKVKEALGGRQKLIVSKLSHPHVAEWPWCSFLITDKCASFCAYYFSQMSGGSALSGKVEDFFEQCGVLLVVGYGLTECSPLLCHRRTDSNLIGMCLQGLVAVILVKNKTFALIALYSLLDFSAGGCVGYPVTDTEIRVVNCNADVSETEREPLERGRTGLVLARGKQVMKGYYKDKKATKKAIDKFGWFNTEDLGFINPATGDLFINGRAKDTVRS